MSFVSVDADKCILCGSCVQVCVRRIFSLSDEALTLSQPENCILCGHCKAVCPEDAVSLPGLNAAEFATAPGSDRLPAPDILMNLFRKRRSTRLYKQTPVEKEKLEQIIAAGRFAPTGGNLQATRYVVVHTPEKMAQIRRMTIDSLAQTAENMEKAIASSSGNTAAPVAADRMQVYLQMFKNAAEEYKNGVDRILWNAPALIVFHVSNLIEKPGVDVGLAGMQMALMAEALGLGSCFIGLLIMAANGSKDLRKALMIPDDHQMVTSMVCGYPDVDYARVVSRNPAKVRYL